MLLMPFIRPNEYLPLFVLKCETGSELIKPTPDFRKGDFEFKFFFLGIVQDEIYQ